MTYGVWDFILSHELALEDQQGVLVYRSDASFIERFHIWIVSPVKQLLSELRGLICTIIGSDEVFHTVYQIMVNDLDF